ncbi:DUF6232 family protein [Streptomyces marokkonensis]|uniref:DUF6232 family protein n=1 Tax=Streptomyces marokkonensis TaxID=324855 RepID=A0ABW6Q0V0_9ACTN
MDHQESVGAPPPKPPQPPPLPPAPSKGGPLVLRVSRRMLWVGSAAIPLHNITWVDAFRIKHNWGAAAARLLVWLLVAVVVHAALTSASEGEARVGENGNLLFVIVAIGLAVVVKDLLASAKPVLVVEMTSGSKVIVTLPSMEELRRIAGRIVQAIDNPEAEFTAVVQQFHSSNTNYYGPVVHMNSGRGNTGFKL